MSRLYTRREAAALAAAALAGGFMDPGDAVAASTPSASAAAGTPPAAPGPPAAPASPRLGSIGLAPRPRSRFAIHTVDDEALDRAPSFDLPFNPGVKIRGYSAIDEPNCQVIVEDFLPGTEFSWVFTHDEFQVALAGEMELEVWLPPLYSESVKTRVKAGDIYTYPVGARKQVRVLGDRPFRHLCFCPPSPGYPFPTLEDLKS